MGSPVPIPAFTQDITARKRSVEHFQPVIEAMPAGVIVIDAAGTIVLVNAQIETMFGYLRAELLGQRIEILIPLLSRRGHHGSLRQSFLAEPNTLAMGAGRELYGLRKDGVEIPVEIGLTPLRIAEGEFVVSSVIDLTTRKHAEEVQQQMTALIDSAGDAIIIKGLDGVIRSWNPAAERLLGFRASEIIGQQIEWIIPEDRQDEESMILDRIRRGHTVDHFETARRRKDGSLFDVSLTVSPICDRTGAVIGASKIMRDITDRKQIEAQLKMTNERFAIASEAAGLGFWDFDIGLNTIRWDDQMFQLYGRSRLDGEQPYALWADNLHPDDRARSEQDLAEAINGTGDYQTEFRIVHPSGEIHHIKASARITRDSDGRAVRMHGVNLDITARTILDQSYEEALAHLENCVQVRTLELTATLKEREVLLQEVHHRVKNNLQVIVSLINLQLGELRDDAGRPALEECQTRVQTIALIHEQLYQSTDYAHIPFSEYAKDLANNIFDAAGISRHAVSLNLEIQDMTLSVDRAIPCGLILNELLTNALKHAFPDGRTGVVRVELKEDPEGSLTLVVSDDGIGLPDDFEVDATKTLGSQLVRILAKQVDGMLEFGSANGTMCRLTIPIVGSM